MALSVEKLLTDAHTLIIHLKDHDSLADKIINTSHMLLNKFEAMKQYQDDITELNEIAKHRPRSTLVLGIAQENRQIRELQQENRELQMTLEEHQSALELIMQKYREHTVKLLQSNKLEKAIQDRDGGSKDSVCHLMDKIDEMAGVMQKAIEVDEKTGFAEKERLGRLELENRALREMLEICTTSKERIMPAEPKEKDEKEGVEDSEDDDNDKTDTEEDSSILVSPDSKDEETEEEEKEEAGAATKGAAAATESSAAKEKGKEKEKVTEDKKKKKSPDPSRKTTTPSTGSKVTATSKSASDVRKGRTTPTGKTDGAAASVKKSLSSTVVKKDSSSGLRKSPSTEVKKEATGSAVRKSPSTEVRKDVKSKFSPKTSSAAKK